MMQSHRSPRQPNPRPRQKPYARRQPPPRSSSIMSTIKNIVTAPLSWFAGGNEFEDTPGKRRRLNVPQSPRDGTQQEPRVAKRQRVASPSPQPTQGYLDPPKLLFSSPVKADSRSQGTQSTAFSPVSVNIPSDSQEQRQQQDHMGRYTYSPIRTTYAQPEFPRAKADPVPHLIARDPTAVPLPQSREQSVASFSHDHSMGPTRTPFRMRTTLSPHPSGADYGPKPQRKERDPSEPPPLTALMSNPIFVKPPPDAHPMQRSLSAQPTVTLGSLAQTHRPTRSPLRQASSLLFGTHGPPPSTDPSFRPVNASEIALSELAVYRTPLLPTRLRGSSAIPDMFKPKKVHQIVPMHKGKDEMPRLGTAERKKKRQKDESGKPYTGQGGMKKLLARRKLEAEEEKKEKSEATVTEGVDAEPMATKTSGESVSLEVAAVPVQEPTIQQHRVNGRETSSLRVGRTRISRQHIERPGSTKPSKNRFSAVYDDEDSMDQSGDMEETPKPVPIFEAPKAFSFALETPSAPISVTVKDAKEPPIPSLPFSLTKTTFPAEPTKNTGSVPSSSAPLQSTFSFAPAVPSTPVAPLPAISLVPPTPQAASKQSDISAPVPTIPKFFANSPLLNKSASAPPTPPSTNLFGNLPIPDKGRSAPPETVSLFGNGTPSPASKPNLLGDVNVPSTASEKSLFGATIPALPESVEGKAPAPTPLHANASAKSTETRFTSSAPLFSVTGSKSPFGLTAAQPLGSNTGESLSQEISGSKSDSTTGIFPSSTKDAVKAPSLFASSGVTSVAESDIGGKSEVPKPSLAFDHPPAALATTADPSKALFEPSSINEQKDVAKPPFSFGFNAQQQNTPAKFSFNPIPTTPATEKQNSALFSSIPSPAPAPLSVTVPASSSGSVFSFGSTETAAADTAKSFGTELPRPTTPKNDQEVRMEESPTRSMDVNDKNTGSFFAPRTMNFDQGAASGSSSTPFTFGASLTGSSTGSNPFASKPEDKAEVKPAASGFNFGSSGSSGFGGFGQKEPVPNQPSFSQSAPFTFGKPENNIQQSSSTSPFGFGTQKLPEINTNIGNQASVGFGFGQRPSGSGQGTSHFSFGQPSPATTATSQFTFSSQGTATSTFGQQNASAPSSPSTFNQPSSFGFGSSTGPSNAFSFQPASPVTNPNPVGAFSFGQSTTPQAQSPASPFSAPSSPQPPVGALFTIGAPPSNPGSRQIKKLPNRRGAKR